jgi:hypothetical protein
VDLPRWKWTISPPRSPAKPGWTALPGHMLNGNGSNGFGASMANGRWSGNLVKPCETWMMDGWNVESENHSGRNFWYIMCYHVLYVPLIFHVSIDGPSPVPFFYMERYSMHGMSRPFWPIEIPRKWVFKTLRVFRDVLPYMFDVFWCYCCLVFIYYLQSHGFIMEKVKYWMVETQNDQWIHDTEGGRHFANECSWYFLWCETSGLTFQSLYKWIPRWFSGQNGSTIIHFFPTRRWFYLSKWIPG